MDMSLDGYVGARDEDAGSSTDRPWAVPNIGDEPTTTKSTSCERRLMASSLARGRIQAAEPTTPGRGRSQREVNG
jgi:hypothetical protein